MPSVTLHAVGRHFAEVKAVDGIDLVDRARRVRDAARARRAAARPRRLRMVAGLERNDTGTHRDRRPRGERRRGRPVRAARPAQARHGVPVLRDLAAHDGVRQRRLSAAACGTSPRPRSSDRVTTALRLVEMERLRRPAGAGAVGRPAAARGDRPRAGVRARGAAARRAAQQPRCAAARADGRRVPRPAAAAQDHHALRHPRPGRGDGALRPRRRDAAGAASCRSARRKTVYRRPASRDGRGVLRHAQPDRGRR